MTVKGLLIAEMPDQCVGLQHRIASKASRVRKSQRRF